MSSSKTFTSARKLDSLPVGSRVTWSPRSIHPTYVNAWKKITTDNGKTGWSDGGSFTRWFPYDAKTALAYNGNRPFRVLSIPDEA